MDLMYNRLVVENRYGERFVLYPHTSDNVVMVRAKEDTLDNVLKNIDDHINNDLIHIKSYLSDGNSYNIHITDETITEMSDMLILLKLNAAISDNAVLGINDLAEYPIMTLDLKPIKEGLSEGSYLLLKYDTESNIWVSISYSNRQYLEYYTYKASGTSVGFYIPNFDPITDSMVTLAFYQTVLQLDIDYNIADDGQLVFLNGYFMNNGEEITATYLKNGKK